MSLSKVGILSHLLSLKPLLLTLRVLLSMDASLAIKFKVTVPFNLNYHFS